MPTPLRRLVAHWPLKLASLGLAILLWAMVSAEQVTMHWIPVRVEPEVRDPRYVLTAGPGPREVRVLFAGPGRLLWQLALDRPTLVLPIRGVEDGAYAVDADMIRFPEGMRSVAVRDIRPAVVRLDVQRLASREVRVRPRFASASLTRYVVRGTPDLTPSAVRVTGPAEDLGRIAYLETEPIDLVTDDSVTFSARVRVDTAGMTHFTVSPASLRVRGELDVRTDRVLTGVRVQAPDGTATGLADLRLSGPSRILAGVAGDDVRVEETDSGPRIRGVPASVQAVVLARRRPAVPGPDSAAGAAP